MLRRQCIRWSVRPTTPKPQWYFEVAHGCWCPITHATAVGELSRLRASHVPGSSASTQQPMVVMRGNTAYQVDLDAMTQTNVQTGRVRKLTVLDVVPPRRTASPRPKRHKPKTPKPPKVTRATTPLLLLDMIKAAQTNDAAELDKLIQRGGNVHGVADEHGHYPIYYAARHGAADSLAVLLKAGANPDYVNVFGDTAAVIAASYGRVDCLSVLHAAKVDFNRPDAFGSTAFLAACFKAHTPCVDYLLSLGSAVDVTSAGNHPVKGYTGAFYLANVNAAAQVDQLLTRHPSLATQPAKDKVTPLMSTVTASLGAPECIALLCRHGADPNGIIPGVRCRPKQLAMFLSSMKNVVALSRVAPKVITMPSRLLPPHQAVPFKLHATPIAIAAGTNMVPCVKYLLSPDGSALRPSKTQVREAAILAAFHGHVECLEVIAARRPQIMRNYARQLYDTAKAHNHDDTANFMTRWYKPQS